MPFPQIHLFSGPPSAVSASSTAVILIQPSLSFLFVSVRSSPSCALPESARSLLIDRQKEAELLLRLAGWNAYVMPRELEGSENVYQEVMAFEKAWRRLIELGMKGGGLQINERFVEKHRKFGEIRACERVVVKMGEEGRR